MLRRKSPYSELEKSIGYKFRDRALLERALTHRSYRFESEAVDCDNQRLEFLGDAVLGLAAATYLFQEHSCMPEGEMTSLRSRITSGKALAKIASSIGLGKHLLMGRGEDRSGGRERPSTLEDALEAVIGAAWLDGGLRATDKIFRKLFMPYIAELSGGVWADNPKGELQELVQRRSGTQPRYRVLKCEGPPHDALFYVEVAVAGGESAEGCARSKRAAEMNAARKLLEKINYGKNQLGT